MKNVKSFLLISALLISITAVAQTNSIHEEKFITIGGIDQWVTIKGNDRTNPVVLFLHGGPGSVMSPYDEAIYGSWEKDFTLVNWDQRGAGRTFGLYAPQELDENYLIENPLTVERMVEDGIELTKYLLKHLKKDKMVLIGTSWGSILGTEMVLNQPELFYAYIGHAQFVNFPENMTYAYQKVLQMAEHARDEVSIRKLKSLGQPPYAEAKNSGQFLRIVKEYERKNSVPAPENWWKLAPEYDNEKDSKDRYDGDDYSFINFVGHEKLGIKSMVADIDFAKDGLVFKVPVYLIQGEEDILTAKEINKPYFDKLTAPDKAYYLLPGAGHGHNQSVVDKQYEILTEKLSFEN